MSVPSDYGKKITSAFNAILQLHSDTRLLLRDCDALFKARGLRGVFQKGNIGFQANNSLWMPEAVAQVYVTEGGHWEGRASGVLIAFFDQVNPPPSQPIIVVSQAAYRTNDRSTPENTVERWDSWKNGVDWAEMEQSPDRVFSQDGGHLTPKVERIVYTSRPLLSIQSIRDVEAMLARLEP